MYGSLTTEAKSACRPASRQAFKAVTISMGASVDTRVGAMLAFGRAEADTGTWHLRD